MRKLLLSGVMGIFVGITAPVSIRAQAAEGSLADGAKVARLVAEPARITMERGQTVPFKVTAYDKDGNLLKPVIRFAGSFRAIRPTEGGIMGLVPGEQDLTVTVMLPPGTNMDPPSVTVPVIVRWPAIAKVDVAAKEKAARLYAGTTLALGAKAVHQDGSLRPDPKITWASSNAEIATVDRFGFVTAKRPGSVTITGAVESVTGSIVTDT